MTKWCAREGCPAPLSASGIEKGFRYCSTICDRLNYEMRWVQRTATECPHDDRLTDQWTAIVEAGDAWAEYRRLVCERAGKPIRPLE